MHEKLIGQLSLLRQGDHNAKSTETTREQRARQDSIRKTHNKHHTAIQSKNTTSLDKVKLQLSNENYFMTLSAKMKLSYHFPQVTSL